MSDIKYRAKYEHLRREFLPDSAGPELRRSDPGNRHRVQFPVHPRGGKTICSILNDEGRIIGMGIAICNEVDNYCKKIGRKISLDRALHSAGLKRSDLP